MLETDIRKIDFGAMNILKNNSISLGQDLDAVILLSSDDSKLGDLVYHKIVDSLIDRIHQKNVYKDFSSALENINAFLSAWMHDGKRIPGLDGYIGLYHKKELYFSTLGAASCYLYNQDKDLIEITDRNESPRDFSFISNGEVKPGESVIIGSMRLLDILSKDDIKDGFHSKIISQAGENIERILLHENTSRDIGLIIFQRQGKFEEKKAFLSPKISQIYRSLCENNFSQKILSYIYSGKKYIFGLHGKSKQIILALAMSVCIFLLYTLIAGFFTLSTHSGRIDEAKLEFVAAQQNIITASENMNDLDVFLFNIESANSLIQELESEKLFLNDLTKLRDEIGILQKQFNGISSFETSKQTLIADFKDSQEIVNLVERNDQIFVIHTSSIVGPVMLDQEIQEYVFEDLFEGDYFIDATVSGTDILLTTAQGKIVGFSNTNIFSYKDVQNQETWEKSVGIDAYGNNIYLISETGDQIIRHKRLGESFDAGLGYLTEADSNDISTIRSLAIDGGIYILKNDGTIVKLFYSPQYRLENMSLNNLPKNYDFNSISFDDTVKLKTDIDLKYVYMLLQNRVLVFEPNSLRFQDVKSLKYIGQIEGKDMIIEDFYVKNDGQIYLASNSSLHRADFDVVEGKLILQ